MSGNWQHKILNFSIPPPAEAWTRIADQLEAEYRPDEIIVSQKLYDSEITPPSFMLDRILDGLDSDQRRPEGKIFSFPLRRAAIAAVTIGLIAITLIYFAGTDSSSKKQNSEASIVPSIPRANSGTPVSPGSDNIAQQNTPPDIETSALNRPDNEKRESPGNNISRSSSRNVKHASLSPVLAANAISPISVSAPPIYDGNGNIIMDENLVSAPDENYIIVTSPNGEQTKISRKFLKMLSVMNGGTDNYYMNAENFEWKLRFEEWRSKLLQQASYIPTANNFLDIMDLKELLQEN